MGSYLDKLLLGLKAIYNAGVPTTFRPNVNLIGATIVDNPTLNTTDVTVGGGAAIVTTTSDFTQPSVGSNVTVTVTSTASFPAGINVFVQHGGYYSVSSVIDGTHFVLTNFGTPGNASPGATIVSGSIVASSGPLTQDLYFFHERANGRFWVVDPLFGATGNGTTNDGPAIQACENARAIAFSSSQGAKLLFSAGTFLTNQELQIASQGAIWEGVSTNGGTTIKTGTIRSAVLVQHNICVFRDLFIDASNASYGILRAGDSQSAYHNINIYNAIFDGFSSLGAIMPGRVIQNIVQTGGGPSIAASASILVGNSAQYASVRLKITVGGTTDGTGQYQVSVDGGVTYGPNQGIYPTSHPAYATSSGVFRDDSGITVTFSGTYVLNTTYDINFTYPIGGGLAVNDSSMFVNCSTVFCGTWYHSATGPNPSGLPKSTAIAGTISVTHNSQLVTGTGTSFLATGARPGDYLWVVGQNVWLQILCVLDDTHIAIGINAASLVTSATGIQFAISRGAGIYDAPQFDAGNQNFVGGNFGSSCCQSIVSLAATTGNVYHAVNTEGQGGVALAVGLDASTDVLGTVVIRPYFEGGPQGLPLDDNSKHTTIINPTNLNVQRTDGLTFAQIDFATWFGRTRALVESEFWEITQLSITSDRQAITVANWDISSSEPPALFQLSANATYRLGDLSTPNINGGVVRLHNLGTIPINIQDSGFGTVYILQSAQMVLWPKAWIDFYYYNGKWYQTNAGRGASYPANGTMGEGSAIVSTTDATPTRLFVINPWNDIIFSGFSADVSGYTSDGTQLGVWEDVRARFANQAQIGAFTTSHVTGTNSGNPPTGWAVNLTGGIGSWQLTVTGAAATNITWRGKIRYF